MSSFWIVLAGALAGIAVGAAWTERHFRGAPFDYYLEPVIGCSLLATILSGIGTFMYHLLA